MEWLQNLLGNSIIHALGWTIVHSIWQISIWAMIAVAILVLTLKKKAKLRYRLLAVVLLGICTTSTITFKNNYHNTPQDPGISVTTSESNHIVITDRDPERLSRKDHVKTGDTYIAGFLNYFDRHLPGIVTLWFLGFIFFFFRYVGSIAWLMRLKKTSEIITGEFEDVLYRYCRKMKLRRIVDIGKSIRISMPVVIGHFKPIILFPAQFLTGLSLEEIESILLHELAHVKRNDFLVNLVQSFIEIIFFYHPAVWWLSASISSEREHVCDDLAIKGGVDANQMAGTLARLAGVFSRVPQYSQAFSGNQYKMKNRIQRLIFNEKMKTNLSQKVFVGLAIIAATLILSFTVEGPDHMKNYSPEGENTRQLETPAEGSETDISASDQLISSEATHSAPDLSMADKNGITNEKREDATKTTARELQSEIEKDSYKDDDDDDDEAAEVLKTLMKKGAKEWNKYREDNPGENFDEALKESSLAGFDLSNFNLSCINLKEADLSSCNFTNADMSGVNIKEAELRGAVLEKANLTNADMKELSLTGISLKGAKLNCANLKEITLINCDLSNSDLSGTIMHEAVIQNCKFNGATADHTTQFPPDFDWAAQGIELK